MNYVKAVFVILFVLLVIIVSVQNYEAMSIAGIIVEYQLVENSYYLDSLRRQYLGEPAMNGHRETREEDGEGKGILGPEEVGPTARPQEPPEEKEPAPRYVNVCFTADAEGKQELDSRRTLKADRLYHLRLDKQSI